MSRDHARVAYDPQVQALRIGDGHSRNGTFVNGRPVSTCVFGAGGVIRIGDTLLVCVEADAADSLEERTAQVAPTELSVLLLGETGTGKEVQARKLHELSQRRGAFVAVNCASIPQEVIAAELFGHTRGAFSGAVKDRPGLFRSAGEGTVFLDEIGDMPQPLQAILLRVLQEKRVRPVGSDSEFPIQARVLAATHADLEQRMHAGSFRPDLYARLSQVVLRLPPLRERRSELLSIAAALAKIRGRELAVSAEAADLLLCWHWPLNIRELESLVALFLTTRSDAVMLDGDFLATSKPEVCLGLDSEEPEAGVALVDRITSALQQNGGKMAGAARGLGVSRQKLYRLMKAAGLDPDDFRDDLP